MLAVYVLIAASLMGCASIDSFQSSDLIRVNAYVNKTMKYRSDGWGEWRADCPNTGDCEDYALCKARILASSGVSRSAMALVVLEHEEGPHAVLEVNGVVLDNYEALPVPAMRYYASRPIYYRCPLNGGRPKQCNKLEI